jgi:hypothetical protein
MNEEFIFRIGADVSGFTKSISDVERELKKVQSELKTKTGAAIVEANKYIAELQTSLVNLRSTGLSKLPQAANQGAASLTALGQVARDAPFGFIAIQNNLPILFDQLGNLTKLSGGVVGAFKSIGSALAGPAGVTFAIGAVIAGATSLIQKYGSIGEGVKVLLGITKELTESEKAFNKATIETTASLNTENYKVDALTKTLLNNKAPQADRIAAYKELKQVAPDVVAGIRNENALTSQSSIIIEANAKARKELTRLKIVEAGISAALIVNETKLAELRNKLTIADQEYVKAAADLNKANKQAIITGFGSQTQQQIALKTLNDNISSVQSLRSQIDNLTNSQNNLLNQLDPVANGIAKINQETNQRIENTKKEIKAENEAIATSKRNAKKNETQQKKNIALREEQIRVDNLFNATKRIKDQAAINKEELKGLRKTTEERRKVERENIGQLPTQISPIVPSLNNEKFLTSVRVANNELERLKKEANLSAAYNLINGTFFGPIEDLFSNFLQTGKFAFKEFAQAILKAISQIVAKVIATGIITLLASLFIPGFAAAGGGVGASLLSGITGALGFGGGGPGGIGKVAAPSFAGVSGGPLNMAGAVNLSLRGSDLVGSINRTNATISRVG